MKKKIFILVISILIVIGGCIAFKKYKSRRGRDVLKEIRLYAEEVAFYKGQFTLYFSLAEESLKTPTIENLLVAKEYFNQTDKNLDNFYKSAKQLIKYSKIEIDYLIGIGNAIFK